MSLVERIIHLECSTSEQYARMHIFHRPTAIMNPANDALSCSANNTASVCVHDCVCCFEHTLARTKHRSMRADRKPRLKCVTESYAIIQTDIDIANLSLKRILIAGYFVLHGHLAAHTVFIVAVGDCCYGRFLSAAFS